MSEIFCVDVNLLLVSYDLDETYHVRWDCKVVFPPVGGGDEVNMAMFAKL